MPKHEEEKRELSFSGVGELNKFAEDVKLTINNAFQCKQYCRAANDIYRKADNFYKSHDEEQAYMLFMRYFHIVQTIKKSYEFVKSKNTYLTILHECSIGSAITKAEELSASLRSRYEKRNAELLEKKEIERKQAIEKANLKKSLQNGDETTTQKAEGNNKLVLPEVPNGFVPKTDEASHDDRDSSDISHDAVAPPKVFPTKGFISVTDLYALIKDYKEKLNTLLMIDIRPVEEYAASRVKHKCIINVPEHLLQFGANINSIERKLSKQTWEVWSTRFEKEAIIIMNYLVENVNTIPPSLLLLQDVLCRFAGSYQVLVLTGGFKQWILHYPSMTTNPFYSKTSAMLKLLDSSELLKDLTYPELPSMEKKRNEHALPSPANQSTQELKDTAPQETVETINVAPSIQNVTEVNDISKDLVNDVDRGNALVNNKLRNLKISGKEEFHFSEPNTRKNDALPSTNTSGFISHTTYNVPHESNLSKPTVSSILPGNVIPSASNVKPVINQDKRNMDSLSSVNNNNSIPPNIGMDMKAEGKPEIVNYNVNDSSDIPTNVPSSSSGSNVPTLDMPSIKNNTTIKTNLSSNIADSTSKGNVMTTRSNTSSMSNTSSSSPILSNIASATPNVVSLSIPNMLPSVTKSTASFIPNISPILPNVSPSIVPNVIPSIIPNVSPSIVANVTPSIIPNVSPSSGVTNVSPSVLPNKMSSSIMPNNMPQTPIPSVNKNSMLQPGTSTTILPGTLPGTLSGTLPGTLSGTLPDSGLVLPIITSVSGSIPQPSLKPKSTSVPSVSHTTQNVHQVDHSNQNTSNVTIQPPNTVQQTPLQTKRPNQKYTTTFGLPSGWEKAVSHETGRIYYKDHNTQSTHWTLPPEILAQVHKSENHHVENKSSKTIPQVSSSEEGKPSMKRSLSSPNLADVLNNDETSLNKEKNVSTKPVIDRSVKPKEQKQVLIDRTKKPISASRLQKLSPVYGRLGHALTGLKNLGNTCYMNSVIQCLSNTTPLSKYFTSGLYEQDLNTKNMNSRPGEIARELSFVIIVLSAGQYRSVSPVDFKTALGRFSSQFNGSQQQDSHELLMFLLDGLHEDINKVKYRQAIKEKKSDDLPDHVNADQAWEDYLLNNDSIIVNLFQGQFRSTLVCLSCGHKSKTFDAFNCLQLELPSNRSSTLEDCISSFTKAEKIGGNDSWKCSKCKCYREASKTIEVWKLPPVLIIQLKRFRCDGRWRNKIQSAINFPLKNLNMTSHIRAPKSQFSNYNLYGVINHYGSFESGHYTASCENAHTGKWYCFDDNIIKELDTGTIKTNAAYLLFYTAVDFKEYLC